VVGVKLLQDGMATGGHSVFNPSTELLLQHFNRVKEQFDNIENGSVQLPRRFKYAKGETVPLQIAEDQQDLIIDGVVNLSR
jgi:hypothetical protein